MKNERRVALFFKTQVGVMGNSQVPVQMNMINLLLQKKILIPKSFILALE